MRVVFLQDVPNVAKAGEVKEVAAGYGRNYLIPKKLAALANTQAVSQVETGDKIKARLDTELVELASQLEGKEVSLKARAGAKDRIYGSITSANIAAELESTTGLVIDKRKIELAEPIRQLGSYEVVIRLAGDVTPKIRVTVTEETAPKEEKKPPRKKKEKVTETAEKAPEAEEKPAKEKKPAKKETKAKKAATKEKPAPKTAKKTTKAKTTAKAKTTTTKAKTTKKKEETA